MQAYLLYPHVVNNCIKRHINIPTYSASTENVYLDEYVQGQPMYINYQQPMYYQGMNQQMMYSPNQYQGNVGTEGIQQQMQNQMPQFNQYPNMMNPYNN